MKPKFIISSGTGWSASTPLWYTLQLDNQYMHTGLKKEGGYLDILSMSSAERFRSERKQKKFSGKSKSERNREWAKTVLQKNQALLKELEKNPDTVLTAADGVEGVFASVRKDCFFTQEEVDDYVKNPLLERYVQYYKTHWKHLQENDCPYQAVGDFSNTNAQLPEKFCHEVVKRLSEDFDVKVLMIVRDPIRRLWSEVSGFWGPESKEQWNSEEQLTEHFFDKIRRHDYWNYIEIIEKWERVCPIHVIIMEQLWEGDQQEREKQRLSDFLDYDIKKIHQNVYCPDCGPNAPEFLGLQDQWRSDKYWLQDELYNKVRPLFPVYQQWVDKYGSLPLYWGKPYNYEV